VTQPHRHTRQRAAVLAVLRTRADHPTAAEVHAEVRRQMPRVSLGTVYRNLEHFVRAGVARKLAGAGREARYDADPTPHDHVRCIRCGRLGDVPRVNWSVPDEELERASGFRLLGVRLEFLGLCPACARGEGENRGAVHSAGRADRAHLQE